MEFEKLAVLSDGASPNCTELSSFNWNAMRGARTQIFCYLHSTIYVLLAGRPGPRHRNHLDSREVRCSHNKFLYSREERLTTALPPY